MQTDLKQPVAILTLRVAEDLGWKITVLDKEITAPEIFHCQDHVNSVATFRAIISNLQMFEICKGNPDQAYVDLCNLRQGKFYDRTGMCSKNCMLN